MYVKATRVSVILLCESYKGVCNIVIYIQIGFIRCDLISGDSEGLKEISRTPTDS